MIKTITIDVMNDKVIKLLQDLELLKLIRMREEKAQPDASAAFLKYNGAMTKQPLEDIDNQLNELRNEWE
jgi:hypothetical protein